MAMPWGMVIDMVRYGTMVIVMMVMMMMLWAIGDGACSGDGDMRGDICVVHDFVYDGNISGGGGVLTMMHGDGGGDDADRYVRGVDAIVVAW